MSLNQNNKLKNGGEEGRFSCCTISRMPSQRALNHTIVSPLKHWRLVCSQRPQGEERTNFSMKSFRFCTCCTIPVGISVGSAEDSLQASGGGASHAAWVLHTSPSVAGGDTVGAMAPVPRPPPCLPVAGRDGAWSGRSLARCSACQWAQPQQAEERHRHVFLDNTTSEREIAP